MTNRTSTIESPDTDYPMAAIADVHCPFSEKFTVPRQPGLTPSVTSIIKMREPYNKPEAFNGLSLFSHIWVIFRFHQNLANGWRAQVRPPRLGGNEKLGVFATRSSFRPNGLGMSVVRLNKIHVDGQNIELHVAGLDVVNNTPVYDIKPYISYSDSVPDAGSGFAPDPPKTVAVDLTPEAMQQLKKLSTSSDLIAIQIRETLSQDPRPAYRKNKILDENIYGVAFSGLNFKWRFIDDQIFVFDIVKISDTNTMN